jgi:hypothetical protein
LALGSLILNGRDEKREKQTDWLLICCFAVLVFGHFFYNMANGRYGERFFFEASFALPVLLARFLLKVSGSLKERFGSTFGRGFIFLSVSAFLVSNIFFYFPATVRYFHESNTRRMDLFLQLEQRGIHNSLIFIRDVPDMDPSFYVRNEPNLSGNVLALDRGPENDQLAKLYPERKRYIYEKSGDRFIIK